MKLVSIHKLKFVFLMLIGILTTDAITQEVWSLNRCVNFAIENNSKLKIDKNNTLILVEKEKEVKSNLIPKLSLNGDYKYYFELLYIQKNYRIWN